MNSAIANRISLVLSFIGIFVAGVLSIGHALHLVIPCGGSHGCQQVADHPSSLWFSIPVAYFGLAAYTAFAVIAILRAYLGPSRLLVLGGLGLALVGSVIQIALSMYAFTVIEATCNWCLASLVTMLLLLITQAVVAQNQGVFERNEKLDLALVLGLSVLSLGALGYETVAMRNGPTPYDPKARPLMTLEHLVPPNAHIYGDVNAPVTIVEFADFFCPGCRQSYPVVKKLVDDHPGKVRLVYRHFPLWNTQGHELAWATAMLSEMAAKKGKFWQFADIVEGTPKEDLGSRDAVLKIASQLGLDTSGFADRLKDTDDPIFKLVWDDLRLASRLGILMTPTFFILAPGEDVDVVNSLNIEKAVKGSRYERFLSSDAAK